MLKPDADHRDIIAALKKLFPAHGRCAVDGTAGTGCLYSPFAARGYGLPIKRNVTEVATKIYESGERRPGVHENVVGCAVGALLDPIDAIEWDLQCFGGHAWDTPRAAPYREKYPWLAYDALLQRAQLVHDCSAGGWEKRWAEFFEEVDALADDDALFERRTYDE